MKADIYVYLDDIDDWTKDHPEVQARLPEGYRWVLAGSTGAWAEPIEET